MANTRKISDCINLRITLGNYQHIEFVKYAEEAIEYNSADERKRKEDELRNDLVDSLIRTIRETSEKFKSTGQVTQVESAIKQKLPQWLEENYVPNIANGALKKEIQVQSAQQEKLDKDVKFFDAKSSETKVVSKSVDNTVKTQVLTPTVSVASTIIPPKTELKDDLFDDMVSSKDAGVKDDLFDDDVDNKQKSKNAKVQVEKFDSIEDDDFFK